MSRTREIATTVHPAILGGVIFLAAILAHFSSLSGSFIWDDDGLIVRNPLVKDQQGLYRIWCTKEAVDYWPVTNSTFWIEWRIWGADPRGYHVTNLLLHAIASVLVWRVLRQLEIPGALVASLLFAVHPVNVEAVAWISQRKTILATLFCLLSVLWYMRATNTARPANDKEGRRRLTSSGATWYWLSVGAFLVGMLSKASIATQPLILLLITWWRYRRIARRDLLRLAPYLCIAVVLVVVNLHFRTLWSGDEIRSVNLVDRILGAAAAPWFYLLKAIAPVDLMAVYPNWEIEARDWLWLPFLGSIAVTALLLWKRYIPAVSAVLFAWLYYCLALVPVMGLTDVGFMKYSLVSDHYQYLAIIGVVALLGAALAVWSEQLQSSAAWGVPAALAAVIALCVSLTWCHSKTFADNETLWQTTIKRNPKCWIAFNNLGSRLVDKDPDAAIKALERAVELKPDYADAHNNLAAAHLKLGHAQRAVDECELALRIRPDFVAALRNASIAYSRIGRIEEALENGELAVRLRPDDADAHVDMGAVLLDCGRFQEAIAHLERALELNSDLPVARFNLGLGLASVGLPEQALKQFELAVQLKPDYAEAWANLASAYAGASRPSEAIEAARQSIAAAMKLGRTKLAAQMEQWLADYSHAQSAAQPATIRAVLPTVGP